MLNDVYIENSVYITLRHLASLMKNSTKWWKQSDRNRHHNWCQVLSSLAFYQDDTAAWHTPKHFADGRILANKQAEIKVAMRWSFSATYLYWSRKTFIMVAPKLTAAETLAQRRLCQHLNSSCGAAFSQDNVLHNKASLLEYRAHQKNNSHAHPLQLHLLKFLFLTLASPVLCLYVEWRPVYLFYNKSSRKSIGRLGYG